jgi:hypothetical protein
MLILGWAVYQILHRAPEHSSNIHVKPETVLHVGRSSEERCPQSQT